MKRAVVLASCLLLTVAGCSKNKDEATPTPTTTTSSATPTPSPTPTEDAPDPDAPAIDYATDEDSGTTVSDADSAAKLPKAAEDFKTFIAAELTRLKNEAGSDCTNPPELRVSKLQNAGWASGGVFTPECGGYAVLWAKQGGEWSQVWGGQELVDCTTLVRYRFPVSVAGKQCLSQEGSASTYEG